MLSSSPAYKKVMENNVKLDLSFNDRDISVEKTLSGTKTAYFEHDGNRDPCKVNLDSIYYT